MSRNRTKYRTRNRTTVLAQRIIELRKQNKTYREISDIVGKSPSWIYDINHRFNSEQMSSGSSELNLLFEVHNYHLEFTIIEKPSRWNPNLILLLKRVDFKEVYMHGWANHITRFADCQVHLKDNTLTVIAPKIVSSISPEDAIALIDQLCFFLVPRLEQEYEIKLSSRYQAYIAVSRSEIALMNDKIFDLLDKYGFRQVKDEAGRVRLKLDRSNGRKHIETGPGVEAVPDMNKLTRLLQEVILGDYSLKDMKEAIITNQQAFIKMKNHNLMDEFDTNFDKNDVDYVG